MKVTAIKFDTDNYAYWVHKIGGSIAVLIDAGSAPELQAFFKENGIPGPMHIFTTHKHFDHCGANDQVKNPETKIYAGDIEAVYVPGCKEHMKDGDSIVIDGMTITAIHAPCHTKGHMLYLFKVNDSANEGIGTVNEYKNSYGHWIEYSNGINRALFTGDTVFVGGCGKFFEGNGADMLKAMDKLEAFPDDLYIFPGHEYSFDNATFGLMVEPENVAMQGFMEKAKAAKEKDTFLIPSTLKEERTYNVFMRCRTKEIQEKVKSADPIECMNKLREAKNNKKFP